MKQRKFCRLLTLMALAAHVFSPMAVHASATAADGAGQLCSVAGKAQAPAAPTASPLVPGTDRHGADHCADCCCGGSAASALPAALLEIPTCACASMVSRNVSAAPASLASLLPPSRAPPIAA